MEQGIVETINNRSPILKITAKIEGYEKESALPSAIV